MDYIIELNKNNHICVANIITLEFVQGYDNFVQIYVDNTLIKESTLEIDDIQRVTDLYNQIFKAWKHYLYNINLENIL